ncbi:hypothetical protein [Pseudomonas agarici]|uniref:hypothetical protein n=2 Tax=Pseudomonas agarici TaxID=46677 RepID=UPI0012E3A0C0|nr:hypothetical protein [Pseudomonas agarici]NWB94242.1 hypothetical protein [Pseudomonas agarici]
MQIMLLRSRFWRALFFLWLTLAVVSNVFAGSSISWARNKDGQVSVGMADGSVYKLKLSSDVSGIFYDKVKHPVANNNYVSIFEVLYSNRVNPQKNCGSGTEIWLYVYEVAGAELSARERVLVSSCWRSISLVSQNSGKDLQDSDFSSVQWSAQGFSIEWFYNVDATGRALSSTNYVWRNNVFLPIEVLSKEQPDK